MLGRAVVTGASGGVGRALCAALAQRGVSVLALGRDMTRLAACEASDPNGRIEGLAADLTDERGRELVRDRLKAWGRIRFLVHSAAVIDPIAQIELLDRDAFRRAYAINVEAPLFLTKGLLGSFEPDGGRVLHLSSGAAHTPVAGCLAYCSSKAAFYMIYRVLQLELSKHHISVGSASPGSVDTEMQRTLRESDPSQLVSVQRFREIKRTGGLNGPDRAARFLTWLLLDSENALFAQRDWNITDAELAPLWDERR